jgi:MoaA/NifB/PqqE/SkfB family radical SAM enzyme/GT2 family glycosyltransferase
LMASNLETTFLSKTLKPICHRPWTGFELVDHVGDVRPCCWGKKSCGNVNEQSPDEIWRGSGFKFYRDRMMEGKTDDICNPWCPILQRSYHERTGWNGFEDAHSESSNSELSVASPEYLRVVLTTACNLKCPMCYQIGDPPAKLPASLFSQLEPWIKKATELLVMGGETFIAKQCLTWIRQVDPETYPHCGLAAITNGLGFTDEVCRLISERHWNWILVSIDAASAHVFAKVRGGDFDALLRGLDRLAETRASSRNPFEIRFGFTLQNSNLSDAIRFVDLCDRYNAMPQYTMVFGDWHNEFPSNEKQLLRFLSTIEKLDKKLWERGFGNQIVGSALAALQAKCSTHGPASRSTTIPLSELIPGSKGPQDQLWAARTDHDQVRSGVPIGQVCAVRNAALGGVRNNEERHCEFKVSNEEKTPEYWKRIRKLRLDTYSVRIPFFERRDDPVSALKVYPAIEKLKRIGLANHWRLSHGDIDLTELGLDPDDCGLEFDAILESGLSRPCGLSVVSAIHNRETELPLFVGSLLNQDFQDPFQLILIDDQSSDRSIPVTLEALGRAHSNIHVLLLRTKRKNRYRKGTFSFGAGLAREIGVRQSQARRILFLDPDQIVDKSCLREHWVCGQRGFQVVVGDRIEKGGDVSSHWQLLRTDALTGSPDWWLSFFTGNASVERDLLVRVGGFDPKLQFWGLDDSDLGYRLFKEGASVWHTRRARVFHLDSAGSGGGADARERMNSFRLHMEVLYRKYLETEVLVAFSFAWPDCIGSSMESH